MSTKSEIEANARVLIAHIELAESELAGLRAAREALRADWRALDAAEKDPWTRPASVAAADDEAAVEVFASLEILEAVGAAVVPGTMRDPFAAPPEFQAGLYRGNDWSPDEVYFVHQAKAETRHWIAKRVVGYGTADVTFSYEGGAGRFTDPTRRLSQAEHEAFGQLAHACGFCSLNLDDPHSKKLGYGPRCAKNNGLPY